MTDPTTRRRSDEGEAAIRLRGVSMKRGAVDVLRQVDWTVPSGAMAAVLGPNGSGKTSLMRLVAGYEWPTTGTVEVAGFRFGEADLRSLRKRVAVVDPSERFGIDSRLTATEAALTGLTGSLYLYEKPTAGQRDRAVAMLETVGLDHRLDQRYELLSTGERRRCLVARALIGGPEVLLLDEPTAGLDVAAREHLLATLDALHRASPKLTTVLITHHVEEIAPATRSVLMLRAGRSIADGSPADLLTPERLSALFDCRVYVEKSGGRYWLEVLPEAWLDLPRGEASP